MVESVNRQEKGPSFERVCLLVLGMHRSGTSALARVLTLLGADQPKELMPANWANESGYWESIEIYKLNDDLLASAGSNWHDWLAFDGGWHASPKAGEFKARAQAALEAEFGGSSFFVLKDPRICRIAPFWLDVLEAGGISPLVLLPLRNPLEVAASLEKRDGLPPALGHLLWLRHVLEAEAATRGRPRLHCSYDELMTDWPGLAARAQAALTLAWPRAPERAAPDIDAFLADKLRHHKEAPKRAAENPALSAWLRETWSILSRWAAEGEDPADFAALDRIRAAFDDAAPAFAQLVAQGREDARRARAAEQAEAEARQTLQEALNRAEAERSGRSRAEAGLKTALAELAEQRAARQQAETERDAARAEAATEKAGRQSAEAERETALAELAEQRAARRQAETERDAARAEATAEKAGRQQAEAALAARIEEIVTLTRLIGEREIAARDRGAMGALLDPGALSLLPAPIRMWRQMARIRRSGLFDAEWYKRIHKDVAASGMDPLRHYVRYGFREGRAPNAATSDRRAAPVNATGAGGLPLLPAGLRIWWRMRQLRRSGTFDAEWYRETYKDVAASGMDPLCHYVRHGAGEGRAPNGAALAAARGGQEARVGRI